MFEYVWRNQKDIRDANTIKASNENVILIFGSYVTCHARTYNEISLTVLYNWIFVEYLVHVHSPQ